MLSVARCRKLIKNDEQLSDEQVEAIRDSLFGLANIVVVEFMKRSKAGNLNIQDGKKFSEFLESFPAGRRAKLRKEAKRFQEEGGLSKDEAERLTISKFIESKRN